MINDDLKLLYDELDALKFSIFKQEEKDTSKLKILRKKIAVYKTAQNSTEKKSG